MFSSLVWLGLISENSLVPNSNVSEKGPFMHLSAK